MLTRANRLSSRFVVCLCALLLLCPPGRAQEAAPLGFKDVTFLVSLLSPLSTKTGKEGDAFTASVTSPPAYQGGIMSGIITKLNRPKKGSGKAELNFQFSSLALNGATVPVHAELKEVANSKGVAKVDDEGQVIGVQSNKKRVISTLGGAGLGALLGAAAGGGPGAAIGAGAGAAAGLIVGMKLTTPGSEIEFKPGSTFTLDVSTKR